MVGGKPVWMATGKSADFETTMKKLNPERLELVRVLDPSIVTTRVVRASKATEAEARATVGEFADTPASESVKERRRTQGECTAQIRRTFESMLSQPEPIYGVSEHNRLRDVVFSFLKSVDEAVFALGVDLPAEVYAAAWTPSIKSLVNETDFRYAFDDAIIAVQAEYSLPSPELAAYASGWRTLPKPNKEVD